MQLFPKAFIFCFSLLFSFYATAADLTESQVRQILDRIEVAVQNLDAAGIGRQLADNVVIEVTVNAQGQSQVIQLEKQQYLQLLQTGWASYEDYDYSQTINSIVVKGNKAYISSNSVETMTMQGKTIEAGSKEASVIELINGVPLVTEIKAVTAM
ncbi:MAG: nuclear transport factor 2 family protein [Pseudomonadota bacterium]|nr:nuclear transport factor 2 family protein [Pseudomonadota bacterium]